MEFAFVVYPEDSSNLPSRTNEVIRLEKRLLAGCLQGRGHILAVFSGGLFPRGKDMYLSSVTRAKVDGI